MISAELPIIDLLISLVVILCTIGYMIYLAIDLPEHSMVVDLARSSLASLILSTIGYMTYLAIGCPCYNNLALGLPEHSMAPHLV